MTTTDIINYVSKTPHNTNPKVLEDMLYTFEKQLTGASENYTLQPPPKNIKNYIDTRSTGFAENAFKDFAELESVYAPHAEIIGAHAFDGCSKLTSMQLSDVIQVGDYAFNGCAGLREFEAFKIVKTPWSGMGPVNLGESAFSNCTNLEKADFHWLANMLNVDNGYYDCYMPSKCFSGCTNLKTFIYRHEHFMYLMDANAFEGTPIASGNGYIYVQSKHIDEYKADTRWSVYADQFRVLEDYTVDGTVDGELDETKI